VQAKAAFGRAKEIACNLFIPRILWQLNCNGLQRLNNVPWFAFLLRYRSFQAILIDGKGHMRTELGILQDYIRLETGYEGEVTSDADLLRTHILDSFSIVQLAMFVQERFGIELEAEDLVRDNLSTLSRVIALIQKKKNTGLANSEPRM